MFLPRARPRVLGPLVRDRKIHLPLEYIDPGHQNPQLVADGKAPARLPADQTALGRIESVEVVGEGRNMDKACEQDIRQFHEQAEIFDFEDNCPENLRIARVELALEEFQLLHFHTVHLRIGRDPLGFGNVFRHRRN